MDELRQNPRFESNHLNDYLIEIPEASSTGRLTNLSRGGLGMKLSRELRRNAQYKFDITSLKSGRRIPCQVKIVWAQTNEAQNTCQCGAKIIDMDPADKVEILDALYEEWKKKAVQPPL